MTIPVPQDISPELAQTLMALQEMIRTPNPSENWNLNKQRLTNAGDAKDPDDYVTLRQLDERGGGGPGGRLPSRAFPAGGGGGTTPLSASIPNTAVLYSKGGAIAGEADFLYNDTENKITLANLHIMDSGTAGTPATASDVHLIVQDTGTADANCSLSILAGTTGTGSLRFGDTGAASSAGLRYDFTNEVLILHAGGGSPHDVINIINNGVGMSPSGVTFVFPATRALLHLLHSGTAMTPAATTVLMAQNSTTTGTDSAISIVAGTAGDSILNLGDTADENDGGIRYDNALQTMTFTSATVDWLAAHDTLITIGGSSIRTRIESTATELGDSPSVADAQTVNIKSLVADDAALVVQAHASQSAQTVVIQASDLTNFLSVFSGGDVVVGSPTGQGKGLGTINAEAVYDDNVLLSDAVWDLYYDGEIRKEDQSSFSDLAILSIDQIRRFTEENRHLPSLPGREEWDLETRSVGELISSLWTTVELLQIQIFDLENKNAK